MDALLFKVVVFNGDQYTCINVLGEHFLLRRAAAAPRSLLDVGLPTSRCALLAREPCGGATGGCAQGGAGRGGAQDSAALLLLALDAGQQADTSREWQRNT